MAEFERMNPEEYREMKKQEKNECYDILSESTQSLMDAGELRKYLDLQARFFEQSPSNVLLIKAQDPEATWIRASRDWKQDEIYPRKGQKGTMLLQSNYYQKPDGSMGKSYRVAKGFDISQTTAAGREVQMPAYRDLAKYIADASSVPVVRSDLVAAGLDAVYEPEKDTIFVREGLSPEREFFVTVREMAYVDMERFRERPREEILPFAECTAYVLARRYGMETELPDLDSITKNFPGKEEKEVRRDLSEMKMTAYVFDARAQEARQRERESKGNER